jgi:hypothetical protein
VSAPNEQAGQAAVGPVSAGRVKADGSRIYRLPTPVIIWWTWFGVAVLGLLDLLFQGRHWISLKFVFGLLTVTGVVYACTIWPKVVADDDGITVLNPARRFVIPWGAVRGIFLADSVEVQSARPAPKKDKTVYSWALSSPRRARARAQLRGQRWDRYGQRSGGRPSRWGGAGMPFTGLSRPEGYDRLPDSAKAVVKLTPAEVMARELGQLLDQARSRQPRYGEVGSSPAALGSADQGDELPEAVSGLPGGQAADGVGTGEVLLARWAWPSLAAVVVPAVAFAITELVH